MPALEALRFHLVGYGCTTCIGNSGPLPEEISAAVEEGELAVVSVLSGNRNFEGRINPDVKMNYLASPPLVVAYALAGTHGRRPGQRAARPGPGRRARLPARHLALLGGGRARGRGVAAHGHVPVLLRARSSTATSAGPRWTCPRATASPGTPTPPTCASRRTSTTCRGSPSRSSDIARRARAGHARRQRHHRPHLAGGRDQEGLARRRVPDRARDRAARLQLLRLAPRQPRGDDARARSRTSACATSWRPGPRAA